MEKKAEKLELTRAEEEIMQILWEIKKGFVKNIVENFPDPKPAYNTVSTIVQNSGKQRIRRTYSLWKNP